MNHQHVEHFAIISVLEGDRVHTELWRLEFFRSTKSIGFCGGLNIASMMGGAQPLEGLYPPIKASVSFGLSPLIESEKHIQHFSYVPPLIK